MLCLVSGAEYFVGTKGSDTHDGKTRTTAFSSFQKGLDALSPGDTLTILPGEYFASAKRLNLGSLEKQTTIRALVPGSVLFRGDVDAPAFSPSAFEGVFVAGFAENPQAVLETDTIRKIPFLSSLQELKTSRSGAFYDEKEKKLYLAPPDGQSPARHRYTIAVIPENGLELRGPVRVAIEGLAFTGYHSKKVLTYNERYHRNGILLYSPFRCVISDCKSFMNGGAIGILNNQKDYTKSGQNLIVGCEGYGGYTTEGMDGIGGENIFIIGPVNDVIRNCYTYLAGGHGAHFYGNAGVGKEDIAKTKSVIENCLAWGIDFCSYRIKGVYSPESTIRNCVAVGEFPAQGCDAVTSNTARKISSFGAKSENNLILTQYDEEKEFADPENLDYRLQSTSQIRGSGEKGGDPGAFPYRDEVFFVKPDGKDAASGTSVRTAWKSISFALSRLKKGDTLYLLPGRYTENLTLGNEGVSILGRGRGKVELSGKVTVSGRDIRMARLDFTGSFTVENSGKVNLKNNLFNDVSVRNAEGIKAVHNVFRSGVTFNGSKGIFLASNDFRTDNLKAEDSAIDFSDCNGYLSRNVFGDAHPLVGNVTRTGRGWNRNPVGIHFEYDKRAIAVSMPRIHSVSATTANIEWNSEFPLDCEIAWGETSECGNTLKIRKSPIFANYSLSGLKPSTRYYFKLKNAVVQEDRNENGLYFVDGKNLQTLSFTTSAKMAEAKTYHVSETGSDSNDGLSVQTAFASLNMAAEKVNAGDTVIVGPGSYQESVLIRATGTKERPITFKTAPGARVVLDGDARRIGSAFVLFGKQHVNLDGFYFFFHGAGGIIYLNYCENIRMDRLFASGTGPGYSSYFINGNNSGNILLKNCFGNNFMEMLHLRNCAVTLENCVSYVQLIMHANIGNPGSKKVVFRNCIMTDSQRFKMPVQLFEMGGEAYVDDNNCHFLRQSDADRKMFYFYTKEERERASKAGEGAELTDLRLVARKSLADQCRAMKRPMTSIFEDPDFLATRDLTPAEKKKAADDIAAKGNKSMHSFPLGKGTISLNSKTMDFNWFFARNPEVVRRGIGLQPEAFNEYRFKQP